VQQAVESSSLGKSGDVCPCSFQKEECANPISEQVLEEERRIQSVFSYPRYKLPIRDDRAGQAERHIDGFPTHPSQTTTRRSHYEKHRVALDPVHLISAERATVAVV
jgi:hypothetical protein